MYKIYFYKDKDGKEPVAEYITSLSKKNDKDSRIKLNKILDYMNVLKEHGKSAGVPYIKRIDEEIWELRPMRDRIFFVAWNGDSFILLHHFMKKTQKTPKREIEQAKREYKDLIERSVNYDE